MSSFNDYLIYGRQAMKNTVVTNNLGFTAGDVAGRFQGVEVPSASFSLRAVCCVEPLLLVRARLAWPDVAKMRIVVSENAICTLFSGKRFVCSRSPCLPQVNLGLLRATWSCPRVPSLSSEEEDADPRHPTWSLGDSRVSEARVRGSGQRLGD